ncbi:MAG: penicillin-binding transpeptidase domain-containing protein [Kofleriaceae bacterium]
MGRAELLTRAAGAAAAATPLALRPAPQPYGTIAPWTTEQVRRILAEELGPQLARGGLVVETTAQPALAADAQAAATEATTRLDHGDGPPEIAAIVWDHRTGYVDALLGGRDWQASQFDRVFQGCRQPGSTWKPLIYAAALEDNSITQGTPLRDAPIAEYDPQTHVHWRPRAGRTYRGVVLASDALAASLNAPTVDVLGRVGVPAVIDLARRLGIDTDVDDVGPMALGASCVKPIELTRAFAVLARGGWAVPIRLITRITRDGEVLLDAAAAQDPHLAPTRRLDLLAAAAGQSPAGQLGLPDHSPIVDARTAFLIDDLLTGPVTRGTARDARRLGRPAAGKTGTTNDNTDAWFVGFTGRVTASVWLGHDDPRTLLGPDDDGAGAALPVWMTLVRRAEGERPPQPVPGPPPEGLVQTRIDRETGFLAARGGVDLWFKPGTEPTQTAEGPRGEGADLGRASRSF